MIRWLFPKISWSKEPHIILRQQENRRLIRSLCETLSLRWLIVFFLAFTYNLLCVREHWHGYTLSFALYFLFGAGTFGTFVYSVLIEKAYE